MDDLIFRAQGQLETSMAKSVSKTVVTEKPIPEQKEDEPEPEQQEQSPAEESNDRPEAPSSEVNGEAAAVAASEGE